MKTKLAALLTGVAMLGGIGIANAADVTTRTDAVTKLVTAGHLQTPGPAVLTDAQMDEVTAAHSGNGTHWIYVKIPGIFKGWVPWKGYCKGPICAGKWPHMNP